MPDGIAVPLANGKGAALIDAADAALISGYSWSRSVNGAGNVYAHAHVPGSGKPGKTISMHQLIGGRGCDHRNGDGLDNRRENLRPATQAQNAANRRPNRRPGGSQFKGVDWHTQHKTWRARIMVNGRSHHLGLFTSQEAAARAYDAAATEAWGEFARLNFPADSPAQH